MMQSRLMSLVEAIANVVVGYSVAVLTQILIFPVFGLRTTLAQNLTMGALFTLVSIARSFTLRRLFEHVRIHRKRGRTQMMTGGRAVDMELAATECQPGREPPWTPLPEWTMSTRRPHGDAQLPPPLARNDVVGPAPAGGRPIRPLPNALRAMTMPRSSLRQ